MIIDTSLIEHRSNKKKSLSNWRSKTQQRHDNCSIEQIVGEQSNDIQLLTSEHNQNLEYAHSILFSELSRYANSKETLRTRSMFKLGIQNGSSLPVYSIFFPFFFPHHPQPSRTSHQAQLSSFPSLHFSLSTTFNHFHFNRKHVSASHHPDPSPLLWSLVHCSLQHLPLLAGFSHGVRRSVVSFLSLRLSLMWVLTVWTVFCIRTTSKEDCALYNQKPCSSSRFNFHDQSNIEISGRDKCMSENCLLHCLSNKMR